NARRRAGPTVAPTVYLSSTALNSSTGGNTPATTETIPALMADSKAQSTPSVPTMFSRRSKVAASSTQARAWSAKRVSSLSPQDFSSQRWIQRCGTLTVTLRLCQASAGRAVNSSWTLPKYPPVIDCRRSARSTEIRAPISDSAKVWISSAVIGVICAVLSAYAKYGALEAPVINAINRPSFSVLNAAPNAWTVGSSSRCASSMWINVEENGTSTMCTIESNALLKSSVACGTCGACGAEFTSP